ncbi:MAG: hypothetical protein JO100_11255 [Pseudonocardia sp.]|nr:hypothetical protein [Pseudonocardia sp.]
MSDTPVRPGPVPGRCNRCGQQVIGCRDPEGRLIPVHPTAVPGGELIVNGLGGTIVRVLSPREAAAAHRRKELGFMPHSRICGTRQDTSR